MKKTLVIHPDDRSTDFLKIIYENLKKKTTAAFFEKYNNIDFLLIRNFDYVSKKIATQNMFIKLFEQIKKITGK